MLLGIDVSDYQGTVDWAKVAESGHKFAFTKATEGTGFVCDTFPTNWAGIREAGIVRGAYHFARPAHNSAEDEADFFLDQVEGAGGLKSGDILVLDLEAGDGDLSAWALAWLERVTNKVGFRPLVYSGRWFMEPHGCVRNDELAQYGLWLASYSSVMPDPPAGWSALTFWQHTDQADVPGVSGLCDESFFNGEAHLGRHGMPDVSDGRQAVSEGDSPGRDASATSNASNITLAAEALSAGTASSGDYVVRHGDTMSAIAAACHCSLDDLVMANPQLCRP